MGSDEAMIFACEASTRRGQREAALLGASLRRFGGALAGSRLWVMVRDAEAVAAAEMALLAEQGAEIVPYRADEHAAAFPFTARLLAAAEAEAMAEREGALLVCMDSPSLVLGDLSMLRLPDGKSLGARPVDHVNVGSPWEAPMDDFWRLVYDRCGVDPGAAWPVGAAADGRPIRAYYNAGLLVLRPAAGLMRAWRERFARVCRDEAFEPLYARDPRYRVFVHQAVLAAVIVGTLGREGVLELPATVNYPLHLHGEFVAAGRALPSAGQAPRMEDLASLRYEYLLDDPGWIDVMPVRDEARAWVAERVGWVTG